MLQVIVIILFKKYKIGFYYIIVINKYSFLFVSFFKFLRKIIFLSYYY